MTSRQPPRNEEAPGAATPGASNVHQTTTKGDTMHHSNIASSAHPVIAGHEITTDEQGRFNLNAIHRASGEGSHKLPSQWARRSDVQELVAELKSQSADLHFDPISSVRGGVRSGTFAHELLAISYAGWISPKFQLQVNQVFLDYRMGRPQQAEPQYQALPSPLTPGHQRTLQRAIARRAQAFPETQRRVAYSRIYTHLKDRFEVASYKDIDDTRFTEALGAVESVSLEGELLTAPPKAEAQDNKRQAEYLMGHHLLWAIHYWREYNVEAALRALGSPAAARIGEHLRVAGVHGRTLLRSHPELLTLAEDRLALDVI